MTKRRFIILTVALCTVSGPSFARDIYVDGRYGQDTGTGTISLPFATSDKAVQGAVAGDVIHLLPTVTYSRVAINGKQGTANALITLRGDGVSPNLTKVLADGTNFGVQVSGGSSYIKIENLDVSAPGPWSGVYLGAGTHHVTVIGNIVHDSGQGGIATNHADYITISYNTVFGNAKYTSNGIFGSGISLYESTDLPGDTDTGIKMVINANIVYGNTNTPTAGYFNGTDPDGSGIIIDDSVHKQDGTNVPYRGTTLIENNASVGNGGRGIFLTNSSNVIVENNTCYFNNQDPNEGSLVPGEIVIDHGQGNYQIYNNILFSDGVAKDINTTHTALSVEDAAGGAGPITIDYNLLYNATNNATVLYWFGAPAHPNTATVIYGQNNRFAQPVFVFPSTDPRTANLFLSPTTSSGAVNPAIGAGNAAFAPSTDLFAQPRTGPINLGALQAVH